jgi:uncharacterized protein
MRVAVLGATGAVGSLLVKDALERGFSVTALARDPDRIAGVSGLLQSGASERSQAGPRASELSQAGPRGSERSQAGPRGSERSQAGPRGSELSQAGPRGSGLRRVAVDVRDAGSVARAVEGCDVLVSGLGGPPGTLVAGASAVVASGVERIVWLGAMGTGPSAAAGGFLTRALLKVAMRAELPDKVEADARILAAGGTLVHVALMTDGPAAHHTVPISDISPSFLPRRVSRAAVAAAMLDEAANPRFPGQAVAVI